MPAEIGNRVLPAQGRKSPRYGHLGLWNYSLGPNSPVPGPRLIVMILDQQGRAVRRLEQIRGNCIDEGYVDFFLIVGRQRMNIRWSMSMNTAR